MKYEDIFIVPWGEYWANIVSYKCPIPNLPRHENPHPILFLLIEIVLNTIAEIKPPITINRC